MCLVIVACLSCKKREQDLSQIDLGYAYFPNNVGSFIVYQVDSTYRGINTEEYHYQIKEELAEQYADNENQTATKINRYYRQTNSQPWNLIDVWSQKRTTNTAEKVIENIRYIKMEFPIKLGGTWDGNGMNNFPAQQFKYTRVDQFADVGILQFDKTVTVEELNNVNFVDDQIFYTTYAKNVGMVFRQARNYNTQGAQTTGYEVLYSAISYSID